MHEFYHLIGTYHEMTRSDRDDTITVSFYKVDVFKWFIQQTELALEGSQPFLSQALFWEPDSAVSYTFTDTYPCLLYTSDAADE